MSEPFLGEIRMVGFNFAPRSWAYCNGELLPIAQNDALFSLLGTIYGGDGRTTFALPDLRGRSPKHPGQGPGLRNVRLGEKGGSEAHTLTEAQMPNHKHNTQLRAEDTPAVKTNPRNKMLAIPAVPLFANPDPKADRILASDSISENSVGGNQQFSIESPYQAINFIIALQGIFPSRS